MAYADIQIPSLLDQLNQRFAPAQPDLGGESLYGGIAEMAEIQKEFAIFKKGRPLQQSMRALNLNAGNNAVRQRWLTLIEGLAKHPSNRDGENGGDAIVNALVEVASERPTTQPSVSSRPASKRTSAPRSVARSS